MPTTSHSDPQGAGLLRALLADPAAAGVAAAKDAESSATNRAFVLLRYTLIIATAALLAAEHQFQVPITVVLVIAFALASNVGLTLLPGGITTSTGYRSAIITADTLWITAALLYSGRFSAEFFYLYFFVLLLAAIGESLGLIAIAAVSVCMAYVYVLADSGASIWSSPSVIRIPFLFTTAAFYGYLIDRTRREKQRARAEAFEEMEQIVERRTAELREANLALGREVEERRKAEESHREEAEVSSLLRLLGHHVIESLGTPSFLSSFCGKAAELLQCDSSQLLLWNLETDTFSSAASAGLQPQEREIAQLLSIPHDRIATLTSRLTTEVVVDGYGLAAFSNPILPEAHHLYLALRRGSDLIGVLVASRHGDLPFTDKENRIARGIAQVASLAVETGRLMRELEQASNLKSEFVATMSHELRTPLNVIMGYNSLLLESGFGALTAAQQEPLQRIDDNARRLLALISETLDLNRLEAGRIRVETQDVGIAELFAEVETETRPLFAAKPDVHFRADLPASPIQILTDWTKLKIIVRNLIDNAVKFTDSGTVRLSCDAGEGGVEICIADTGVGIPEDKVPIIFEPFRQVDASMTRRHAGIGLGLHIVRRLLELLGGSISVETAVGRGSTFRVRVPHHQAARTNGRLHVAVGEAA